MKLYNKILEAVSRGIKFALDDFEDQNDIQGLTNSKVNNNSNLKEYVKLLSVAVDMGLPSGTWWFKYNIGVNPETAKTCKDWYGKYYQWGDIKSHYEEEYIWRDYKYSKRDSDKLTKYCTNRNYGYDIEPETDSFTSGFKDDLTELLPEDDIATQTYGDGYHIPTREQWKELIENSELSVIDNYQGIYDCRAFILTSKINGNKIYIPASGYINEYLFGGKAGACLWSSTLYKSRPTHAWRLAFRGIGIGKATNNETYCERSNGFVIRPVYNEK